MSANIMFREESWYCRKYQLTIWPYTLFARFPLKTMSSPAKPQHIQNLVDKKIFLLKLERWELGVWSVDESRFYLNLRFNLKGLIINPIFHGFLQTRIIKWETSRTFWVLNYWFFHFQTLLRVWANELMSYDYQNWII